MALLRPEWKTSGISLSTLCELSAKELLLFIRMKGEAFLTIKGLNPSPERKTALKREGLL